MRDRRQLRLRARRRRAASEKSLERQRSEVTGLERPHGRIPLEARPHHQRREEFEPRESIEAGELGGRHADDGELDSVEPYGPAHHRVVGSTLAGPEIVAENDDGVASWHGIFFGAKGPSERRFDADG